MARKGGRGARRSRCRESADLPHDGFVIPARLVDALPKRLWTPGNFFIPRVGDRLIGHWHFCVGRDEHDRNVRTIERNFEVVGRGRKDFNFAAYRGTSPLRDP